MMIDVVVRGVDEIKLLCSLHEVVITSEVVISYVTVVFTTVFVIAFITAFTAFATIFKQ